MTSETPPTIVGSSLCGRTVFSCHPDTITNNKMLPIAQDALAGTMLPPPEKRNRPKIAFESGSLVSGGTTCKEGVSKWAYGVQI